MGKNIERMKDLVINLNKASEEYYQKNNEIMSNKEYDKLYNELEELEELEGVILSGSVTQKVGYDVQSKLDKIEHTTSILSLDKTKDPKNLKELIDERDGFLSWKLDGLTIVATYNKGELVSAVTRGNGKVGEDVTANYKAFSNVPLRIKNKEKVVLRGEAVISYDKFEEINGKIELDENKYKNPRNLCSGSVRQLDANITKERGIEYIVFRVEEGLEKLKYRTEKLEEIRKEGFNINEYGKVNKENLQKVLDNFTSNIKEYKYPCDGLVLAIDDIEYSKSLGETSKFPRDSKAFKWEDEIKETKLKDVFWSNSRTGAINPVAIFEPVELDGTTVERASVHNINIFESLELGIGDKIRVYKANMIIPQVEENTTRSNTIEIPKECPICKGETKVIQSEEAKVLYCTNKDCMAKHIGELNHFTKRDAMNIESLSEATLEKFVREGIIKNYKDIYYLKNYKESIMELEGFGKKSYERIINAVERSRDVELSQFIYSLGVVQMGRTTSRLICDALDNDLNKIMDSEEDTLSRIKGIGKITAKEIVDYFRENKEMVKELAKEVRFKEVAKVDMESPIAGKTFVLTGKVKKFKNRKEVKAKIESLGGKVSGSVSGNTDYLMNNDIKSTSNKNKEAKQIGVPIISEDEFLEMIGE